MTKGKGTVGEASAELAQEHGELPGGRTAVLDQPSGQRIRGRL